MRKPGPPREIPPPLELECLKVLWKLREANVRDVRETLSEHRKLAYTTVMTLLDRLVRKGGAVRRKSGRSFLYTPVLSRELLRRAAIKDLVEAFFDGSEEELLAYLQGGEKTVPPSSMAASDHDSLDTTLL